MNYFKVSCAGVFGRKIAKIEVECVQQRRLPHLQIIGISSSSAGNMRERVLAALESGGFRLPARRLTVSLLGSGPPNGGELDLAVALAILGSMKAFSQQRMEKFSVAGGLSLDGRMLPLACRAPLRAWNQAAGAGGLILPWEDSHILGAEGRGGGFHRLEEVVAFLRGSADLGPRLASAPRGPGTHASSGPRWARGRPVAQRILCVAAAGGHPLLVFGGEQSGCRPLAEDLLSILPPPAAEVSEELLSFQRAMGEGGNALRELSAAQARRLLRFDPKAGNFGEMSLAHGGILLLSGLGPKPAELLAPLAEPLASGSLRCFHGGQSFVSPADWQLVAGANNCLCGGEEGCRCPPAEKERWRRRLEQVREFFPLLYRMERPAQGSDEWPEAAANVESARHWADRRQGCWNNRLREDQALAVKSWSEEALGILRAFRPETRISGHVAKVALTLSDLRGSEAVEKPDIMEARHYVPESFLPSAVSGRIDWSASKPETKSRAMP